MPDTDIILEKTENIRRCLRRIKEVTELDPSRLDNIDIQDIFVLNLQRAIQAAIDLAVHIISDNNWPIPKTARENFDLLAGKEVLTTALAEKMKKMVGFRNIAIHDYRRIDVGILKSILTGHLIDLEEFYRVVLKKYLPEGKAEKVKVKRY